MSRKTLKRVSWKTCERCGNDFPDRSPPQTARFCSDNCRKRAHEHTEKGRGRCEHCGSPKGVGTAGKHTFCLDCRREAWRERHTAKLDMVERMWADGKTLAEITAALGRTYRHSACTLVDELRKQGRAPYRHKGYPKTRQKAA